MHDNKDDFMKCHDQVAYLSGKLNGPYQNTI